MWESTRTRGAVIGFAMVLCIFLANGVIGYLNVRRMHRNAGLVAKTHEVIDELKNVRITMADAETGMRGFVIAGDPTFLEPYREATKEVHGTLGRLETLSEDDPERREATARLRQQIEDSLAHIRKAVSLVEAKQTAEAEALIRTGKGKLLMDRIRLSLAEMEKQEVGLLIERDIQSNAAYRIALFTGTLTTLFGLGLTAAAMYFVVREVARRVQAAEELAQANAYLEQRVAERTHELSAANGALRNEIDERQRTEEQVRLFAEELQRSNRELEQFASVASHDLQEPLRKIQAFGNRLSDRFREELGEQGQDYIDRMLASASRMRKLIDDLLEYSRVTTKAQPFAPVDLNDIVQEVAGDLETRLQQTGGRIEIADLPVVRASPLQMRQLFQNLMSNALKFHRPNLPPVVRVTASKLPSPVLAEGEAPSAEQCQIIVEDNGIGFEPQYGERIFDLFQRLHGRDEYEGTGIGLAICRKIVDRHNGDIKADSTPGAGARFTVTLPLDQPA